MYYATENGKLRAFSTARLRDVWVAEAPATRRPTARPPADHDARVAAAEASYWNDEAWLILARQRLAGQTPATWPHLEGYLLDFPEGRRYVATAPLADILALANALARYRERSHVM